MSAQQQQLGLHQQMQHRLMRMLVKIIKANGLADGDFGLFTQLFFLPHEALAQRGMCYGALSVCAACRSCC